MVASILRILIIMYSVNGWLRPCHIYHVFELSYCISHCRFSAAARYDLVKHLTSLSLSRGSCFRGHLLRSNLSPLVTVLVTLAFAHWRTHLWTCDQWHNLKTLALDSPKYELQNPWRHLLKISPKKCPFSISAGPQCLTRANGSVPTKRARP